MKTEIMSKQIRALLDLIDAKGMTPDRMTMVLSSGILADVFDKDAHFENRRSVRLALGLTVLEPGIPVIAFDKKLEQLT